MTTDAANFRQQDIEAVYCGTPICCLTNINTHVDRSHILGRGFTHGVRPKSEDRKMFSSIFNYAPLSTNIHAGAYRDEPYMRALLLQIAREKVMYAVGMGHYELKELDKEFLLFADTWLRYNLPKLS